MTKRIFPWRLFIGSLIPDWLERRPDVLPGTKLAYARLARYAGQKDRAYPRMATLARAIGVSERQAQRYVQQLVDLKLIEVELRREQLKASYYFFLDHPWMHGDEECDHAVASEDTEHSPSSRHAGRDPHDTDVVRPHDTDVVLEENQVKESQRAESSIGASAYRDTHPVGLAGDIRETSPGVGKTPTSVDLDAVVAEAKARTQRQMALNADRAIKQARGKEQRKANLKGKERPLSLGRKIQRLEELWLSEMRVRWPDTPFGSWSAAQRDQIGKLLDKYPGDSVEHAIKYLITRWDSINARIFRGRGSFPTVGTLSRWHDLVIPEAQSWLELSAVEQEYDAWFKAHPNAMSPPAELRERFQKAKKTLAALDV